MNPQEYISTGILELYVLGAASHDEIREVEKMAALHTEIRYEIERLQIAMEKYAEEHRIIPDKKNKLKILSIVSGEKVQKKSDDEIVSGKTPFTFSWKPFAVAASLLLIISISVNFFQWHNLNATKENDDAVLAASNHITDTALDGMTGRTAIVRRKMDSVRRVLNFLRDPMTQNVALESKIPGHPMKAVVHWNMKSMEVAVDPMTLPMTSPDQKYVLWAFVNGNPINEGSFSVNNNSGIQMMKTVQQTESFAVSLEKSGDVIAPLGPVYVMGDPARSQP
ncbi:MAG: anti-sigma factor [Bacteroidetes bacterium]|nr:anti-sigma factor [Bacteroidota bacterium]